MIEGGRLIVIPDTMNKRRFQVVLLMVVMAVASASVFFWSRQADAPGDETAYEKKLRVVATFYPLAEFSRMVGGDRVEMSTIVSPGVEPHDYEPTPRDVIAIERADVFVINGAGMDPWAEKLVPSLRENGVAIVTASESVALLPSGESDHDGTDPHFWLDPIFVESIIGSIRVAFSKSDPAHIDAYDAFASAALSELAALDGEYRTTLSSCSKNKVVVSHGALSYLSKRYGFEAHPISGISPETEPSIGRILELAKLAEKEDIRYIFFETLTSPKVSETLAREVGAETLVFDPIEGLSPESVAAGKNYFSLMRENLANLSTALECME